MSMQTDERQPAQRNEAGSLTESQSAYIREPLRDDVGAGDASADAQEARLRSNQHRRRGDRQGHP